MQESAELLKSLGVGFQFVCDKGFNLSKVERLSNAKKLIFYSLDVFKELKGKQCKYLLSPQRFTKIAIVNS